MNESVRSEVWHQERDVLESERLGLREIDYRHAGELAEAIFQDPRIMEYSDGGVLDDEQVRAWIHKAQESYRKNGFGPWLIVDKATSTTVGYCGLFVKEIDGQKEVEIGHRIAQAAQGKGLATEAAGAVLDYAKNVLLVPRIVALIDPENNPSLRVAEKLGFRRKSEILQPGYDHPDHLYAIDLKVGDAGDSPSLNH